MSERTPPETVRERAITVIANPRPNGGLKRYSSREQPDFDPRVEEAKDIIAALEAAGLTIIDTAALEPGEDDGDGQAIKCQTCDMYFPPDEMAEDSGDDICERCDREKWGMVEIE